MSSLKPSVNPQKPAQPRAQPQNPTEVEASTSPRAPSRQINPSRYWQAERKSKTKNAGQLCLNCQRCSIEMSGCRGTFRNLNQKLEPERLWTGMYIYLKEILELVPTRHTSTALGEEAAACRQQYDMQLTFAVSSVAICPSRLPYRHR